MPVTDMQSVDTLVQAIGGGMVVATIFASAAYYCIHRRKETSEREYLTFDKRTGCENIKIHHDELKYVRLKPTPKNY